MKNSKLRLLGMSALVGAGLMATGPAGAYELRLGGVDVQIDTTASVGLSVRMADRDMGTGYVAEMNGGPKGKGVALTAADAWGGASEAFAEDCSGTEGAPGDASFEYGKNCAFAESAATGYNYSGSPNEDNGRLNFDNGDLTGGTFKLTTEFDASLSDNVNFFGRVTLFSDPVLADESSYEREGSASEKASVTGDLVALDAYFDYNADVAGNPVLLRAGRQVINWGEATFSIGGNAAFNPLDVAAFVRPGAEIKEAFIPVNALYGSIGLPYDLTLEAYAALEHRGFGLVRPGTPFSGSDVTHVTDGGTLGQTWLASGLFSGSKFNCDLGVDPDGTNASGITQAIAAAIDGVKNYSTDPVFCDGGKMDWRTSNNELERAARGEGFDRVADYEGDESGDMGIALRYYSEALNSTEFGLYYQQLDSRIPYGKWISNGPTLSFSNMGPTASAIGHVLRAGACLAATAGDPDSSVSSNPAFGGVADVVVKDPKGIASALAANTYGGATTAIDIGDELTMNEVLAMSCRAEMLRFAGGASPQYAQTGSLAGNAVAAVANGELSISTGMDVDLALAYPEDIEVIGMSFNTTLAGWGVQGEIAHKPDFPLSTDSNEAFLVALMGSCIFEQYPVYGATLNNFGAVMAEAQDISCSSDRQEVDAYFLSDITNYNIGTTATFTRSNPVTNFIGADLLVLLTEFNGVHFADEGDHDTAQNGVPALGAAQVEITSASACTRGSDIAAGGTFSIDPEDQNDAAYIGCRATRDAYEGIILVSAQYNNVFGTPVSVSPRLVHREGLAGIAPRPAASFVEGVSSTNIGLTAEYQGQWKAGLSYTMYGGDRMYTKNLDRDFLAIDVSYAF